ncbi:MAG TPA: tetratricopeptide repeat protein, partial [Herpetosiphonaceae bacterium]|nr:tetratricopeptide repeat protein [Herpetosiphonaceae bacterium]
MIGDSLLDSGLQLNVLGALRVRLGELSLGDVLSQKARALLCYIAIERREHSRSALAALLWGEFPEADAATNLRQALTHLRRTLDPYLTVTRHTVTFNSKSAYWLDTEAFERWLTAADNEPAVEQLEAAIELYQGDFLQGFVLRDAPAFEEWMVLQRERYHVQALEALQRLADYYRVRGDYAASITSSARLLALDSWREEAHRQLMWLYVRTGQRSAALAQYQSCHRLLEKELGVEPMAETTALYERIKAAQAAPPHSIVVPATPFVGRITEQRELARRLAEPGLRLLTIIGPGGIGKTRLAMEVASKWATRFLHGVRVIDLTSVTTSDAFISTLVSVLGCGLRGSNNPLLQVRSYLADKDMLLVLDNFEHLVDKGTEVVVDILRHAPEVKVLVTSRERLQLQDEWLSELAGLDLPSTMADIENSSAVELFVQSARKLRSGFALSGTDVPAVARICRLVEGTPLGIELSAAWTRLLSCEEIAEEIERSLEFLTTSLRDLPARHRSLRAVFDHSWRLLGPEEQRVLRRLTVFRGGFSRDVAEQVVAASASLLGTLLDKSLLYIRPDSAATPRYDMHEMVRHYARLKVEEAGELEGTQARHLSFFLQLAETAQLVGEEQKLWLERLEREHDNLREALQVALDSFREEHGLRLAAALWRFWWTRGYLEEGCRWLQQVLFMEQEFDGQEQDYAGLSVISGPQPRDASPIRAQALHGLGVLLQEQGNYKEAQASHEQSLTLRRAQGDRRGIAFSLNSLGVLAMDQGDYARAEAFYEESLTVKRELGDKRGISGTLNNLGIAVSAQGHAARAQALYEESLQLCRALSDQDGIAVALANLALVALDRRDLGGAELLLKESLALFRELGDKDGIVECLEGLAGVATVRRHAERAVRLFGVAAAVRRSISIPWTSVERFRYEPMIAQTRSLLDETMWMAIWGEGQALT